MDAVRRSLEVDYLVDMITHNGFEITKPNKYSEVNINIDALVNSPRYMDTEYTCDCGAFIGRDVLGQKCPKCGSEISLRSLSTWSMKSGINGRMQSTGCRKKSAL